MACSYLRCLKKSVTILNAGIGSGSVGTVLAMVKKLAPRFPDATFFIHIGINNCIRNGETTLVAFEELYKKILKILVEQHIKVIISTIMPVPKIRAWATNTLTPSIFLH